MSTDPISPAPTPAPAPHNPLKDKALEIKEVPEVLDFLRENGVAILVGAGIAAVLFLGWSLYRNYTTSEQRNAMTTLFNAQAPEQIQQVLNEHPRTPAAPLARLIMAGQAFDQGQYDMAQNLFTQFIEQHPDHELRDTAELGTIQCLEAQGRHAEALEGYTKFAESRAGHYLEPAAQFGRARSLELLGRLDEAKAAYEAFIATREEEDRWRGRAESALAFLEKEIRARARGDAPMTLESPAPAFSFPALQGAPEFPTPAAP